MAQVFDINNKYQLEHFIKWTRDNFEQHGYLNIKPSTEKPRSPLQNNALHKYCGMVADELNDKGLDMRKVLKPEVDIPWTTVSAKEHLWRPIQKIMTGEESTTKPSTAAYPQIYETINRHLGEKWGVYVPWPSKETKGES